MTEHKESEANSDVKQATTFQEEDLRRAVDLIASVVSQSYSTRVFGSKWQLIRGKMERLKAALSAALLVESSMDEQLSGEIPAIVNVVRECEDLAQRCTELTYSGKLLMQSDLDAISGKIDVFLRQIKNVYSEGVVKQSSAIVVSRPPPGASREDMKFFVRDLFNRMQIGSKAMKIEAVKMLEEIVEDDEKYQRIVMEAGDLNLLVKLLESSDEEIQAKSAGILLNIAGIEAYKPALVTAGIIFPLIKMLESGGNSGKESAAATLNRLTANSDNAWSVSAQGGATVLLTICRREKGRLQREAAGTLRNLAGVEEIRRYLTDQGAISVMTSLLRSSEEKTQSYASDCLRIMSFQNEPAKNLTVREGGIQSLVSILSSTSIQSQQSALRTICNFTNSLVFWRVLHFSGYLDRILNVLKSGDSSVLDPAVKSIRNVSRLSEDTKKAVADAGVLPELVKLLEAKSPTVRELAAESISLLVAIPKNRNRFVQIEQDVVRILQNLHPEEDQSAIKFLLLAMLSLTTCPAGRRKITSSPSYQHLEILADREIGEAKRIIWRLSGNKIRKLLGGIWKT